MICAYADSVKIRLMQMVGEAFFQSSRAPARRIAAAFDRFLNIRRRYGLALAIERKTRLLSARDPVLAGAENGCSGANLAVRWPQREGPFSDGERKSVGRVPCFR